MNYSVQTEGQITPRGRENLRTLWINAKSWLDLKLVLHKHLHSSIYSPALHLCCVLSAYRSQSSREMLYFAARFSAVTAMGILTCVSVRASHKVSSSCMEHQKKRIRKLTEILYLLPTVSNCSAVSWKLTALCKINSGYLQIIYWFIRTNTLKNSVQVLVCNSN